MSTIIEKKRWPLALIIIAAVVVASVAIALSYRSTPGRIPVQAISGGSGGAIIAWENEKGIYAQRIDSSGQPQWQAGGIFICECPPTRNFDLTPDGMGGAIITWNDRSNIPDDRDDPAYFDPVPFYSQRISFSGELLWGDGIIATGTAGLYGVEFPRVVAGGTGGAIFVWNNYKTYYKALHDDFLRLQKIASDGRRLWSDEGVLLVASFPYRPLTEEEIARGIKGTITRSRPTYEGENDIVSDGAGGVIVFWEEETEYDGQKVYAQRLDGEGNPVWPDRVVAGVGSYYDETAKSDGAGGAALAFTSEETGVTYLQHISGNGELLETEVYSANTVNDGLGGTIQVRVEAEPFSGPPWEKSSILYVQRLGEEGQPLWPEKQVLATAERQQLHELVFTADGTGGVILAWQLRKEYVAYGGLFAQRLDAEGNICWGEEGLPVFTAPDIKYQGGAVILSDDSGGVLIIAAAGKSALSGDMVYVQKLDTAGNRLWGGGIRIDR